MRFTDSAAYLVRDWSPSSSKHGRLSFGGNPKRRVASHANVAAAIRRRIAEDIFV
jgi:hypothetical protein